MPTHCEMFESHMKSDGPARCNVECFALLRIPKPAFKNRSLSAVGALDGSNFGLDLSMRPVGARVGKRVVGEGVGERVEPA